MTTLVSLVDEIERVKDHNGRDKSSHMLRHSIEKNHTEVTVNDFKVIERNYRNNVRKRKAAEALLIKQFRPTLNVQVSCFETFKLISDVFGGVLMSLLLTLSTVWVLVDFEQVNVGKDILLRPFN